VPRVVDADARGTPDPRRLRAGAGWRKPERLATQVRCIEPPVDVHRAAQKPRSPARLSHILHRCQSSQQYRMGLARGGCHDIEAIPHAVDQVHISVPGRAEHDVGARRVAARGMRRQVLRAAVRFSLDDAAHAPRRAVVVHQLHADQLACDLQRAACVKVAR